PRGNDRLCGPLGARAGAGRNDRAHPRRTMSFSDQARIIVRTSLEREMLRLLSPLITLLFPIVLLAQDTVQLEPYTGAFTFNEGIYFNFEAFRHNKPSVPKENLRNAQGL